MRFWFALAATGFLFASFPALAAEAPAPAIAPVIGDEVFVVIAVDLSRADVPALARAGLGKMVDEEGVSQPLTVVGGWLDALKNAGARELFVLFDGAEMPGYPVVAVPLPAGADGGAIVGVMLEAGLKIPLKVPASETIRGVVVAGSPGALARIRSAPAAARPELADALAAGGDAAVKAALVPSATQRRAVEESMTRLPAELGGGPIATLTQGLRWVSLALPLGPTPVIRAVVQGRDAPAAGMLEKMLQDARDLVAEKNRAVPDFAPMIASLRQIKPEQKGDRITLEADLGRMAGLVAIPVRRVREAAGRTQCVNHLKQIGLAMHNYHGSHNTFPPAYSVSKQGKPLLSWRVHILPLLEAKALYNEFHLDESWDSPHNKALIERMPPFYACPNASRTQTKEGKTTYLTLRGPSTMFPGATGMRIQDIVDGASNTILAVDTGDGAAVPWTKPDDYDVAADFSWQGLSGHHHSGEPLVGTNFLFGDGSVRFLTSKIAVGVMKKLATANGREVIGMDEL